MEQKVFNLDSEKNFNSAERFKAKLENQGFKVIVDNYGFNSILIKGVLK